MKERVRCIWPGTDPLYVAYHDKEWGVPEYDSRALYEKLVLDGFQAGLSWITILRKRENFRKAFHDFNPEKIARYGKRDSARLMKNEGIIRSNAKIAAAIKGAQLWLDTGWNTELRTWKDSWHVPVGVGASTHVAGPIDLGAELGFRTLLGPQNSPNERVLCVFVGFRG